MSSRVIAVDSSSFLASMSIAKEEIAGALRHGVSGSSNILRDATKRNLQATGYNVTSSSTYGVGLIEGIRTFMLRDMPVGIVSIAGNRTTNDGTWRLRFYNAGTKDRYAKKSKRYLGKIPAKWFFDNAISSTEGSIEPNIEASINEAINRINSES